MPEVDVVIQGKAYFSPETIGGGPVYPGGPTPAPPIYPGGGGGSPEHPIDLPPISGGGPISPTPPIYGPPPGSAQLPVFPPLPPYPPVIGGGPIAPPGQPGVPTLPIWTPPGVPTHPIAGMPSVELPIYIPPQGGPGTPANPIAPGGVVWGWHPRYGWIPVYTGAIPLPSPTK